MMPSTESTLRSPWARLIFIAVIVGGAASVALPLREKVRLGLDLQGGTYMVLRVELNQAVSGVGDRTLDEIRTDLVAKQVPFDQAIQESPGVLRLRGLAPDAETRAADTFERRASEWERRRDGADLVLSLRAAAVDAIREGAARQVKETINRRINAFGVGETQLQQAGDSGERLVLQMPGLDDVSRVKGIITRASALEFRLGDGGTTPRTAPTREQLEALYGVVPEDVELLPSDPGGSLKGAWAGVKKGAVIRGEDLIDAKSQGDRFGRPAIGFSLSSAAGDRFGVFTGGHIGQHLAVVLDGHVVQFAEIKSQIFSQGEITGSFSVPEAHDAALTLRSGALPAKVTILEERTVGPTLGRDSVESGLKAVVAGFIAVMIFLLLWYKFCGINALLALVMNIIITMAMLKLMGAALTLPGIAGLILTLVSAVDANVIIFERIKEELVAGKGPLAAISAGFDKAFSAIFDSNATTLLAAFFLYNFGTGPIRGFAVTLALGIMASMFTAIYVSRVIFETVLWLRPQMKSLSIMWHAPKPPLIRFMRAAPIACSVSIVLVLGGLWMWLGRGLEYGIDFKGGIQAAVKLRGSTSADELRARVAGTEFENIVIQNFGSSADTYLLRILGQEAAALAEEVRDVNAVEEPQDGTSGALARLTAVLDANAATDPRPDINAIGTQALADELRAGAGLSVDEALQAAQAVTGARVEAGGILPADLGLAGLDIPPAAKDWITANLRSSDVAVISSESVGPAIGAELRSKALAAILWSLLAILAYASFKFKFRYGLGAIVAVAHDVVVAIGVLALLGFEFDINIIAALLTLAGYSLNDTIVIFDRVRELAPKSELSLSDLLDESVSLCLSRTFLTMSTSLMATLSILFFGGPVLQGFALALAIGMVAGAYSTIFVASPVVLLWDRLARGWAARQARAAA